MNIHKNARLTPKSRAELVRRLAVGQSKVGVARRQADGTWLWVIDKFSIA
jgi:hypothetical protein